MHIDFDGPISTANAHTLRQVIEALLERIQARDEDLDLAALSRIAKRLPLGEAAHNALRTYAPQGQVETLQATWQGPFDAQGRYQIKARIHGLALGDTPATAASASTATTIGYAVGTSGMPSHTNHQATIMPPIGWPPIL